MIKIINKKSNIANNGVPKIPQTTDIEYGELAINYSASAETIFLKNTNDDIIEFKSKDYVDNALTDYAKITDVNVKAVDTSETLDDVETNTYVKYVAQTLTDNQKAQVRENIGVDLSSYATRAYVDGLVGDINSILETIIGSGVTLITFTVNGTEYQAEDGMTWEEFINSNYNDGSFDCPGEYVTFDGYSLMLFGGYFTPSEEIIANASYSIMAGN